MPLIRDSLAQLIDAIRGDIRAEWPGVDATTRRSPLDAFARVLGYVHHTVNGWLDTVAREMMANTASLWLERHGSLWGIPRLPASFATGAWTATGTAGRVITSDARLRRGDGVEYAVEADVQIGSGGSVQVPIVAVREGAAANCIAGTTLTLVSPIGGVTLSGTVASPGLAGGADEESVDAWRERILAHIRFRPHGGARADYDQWTRLVSGGITRVWVFPRESGPGTVTVRFAMDDAYADGIPQPADVALVQAYLDRDDVRPVTATVLVAAPAAAPLNPRIRIVPDTPSVRAAVEAELRALLRREGAPAATLPLTHIAEAISIAAGETDHTLISPVAGLVTTASQLPTLGSITWETA